MSIGHECQVRRSGVIEVGNDVTEKGGRTNAKAETILKTFNVIDLISD
jgi:hypothetical protein